MSVGVLEDTAVELNDGGDDFMADETIWVDSAQQPWRHNRYTGHYEALTESGWRAGNPSGPLRKAHSVPAPPDDDGISVHFTAEADSNTYFVKGDKGERGEKGERGDQGLVGEKGDKGDQGETGLQGEQGLQGIQGIPGVKGDKGDQGNQGIQGIQGIQGLQGIPGIKGDTGEKGDQGDPGIPSPRIIGEFITGTKNGVNTTFTTASAYVSNTVALFYNGLREQPGIGFLESGPQEITITTAPDALDAIVVDYLMA